MEVLRRGRVWEICFIKHQQDFLMERICHTREEKEPRITLRGWDWVLVGCWGRQWVWGCRQRRMASRNQFASALP